MSTRSIATVRAAAKEMPDRKITTKASLADAAPVRGDRRGL